MGQTRANRRGGKYTPSICTLIFLACVRFDGNALYSESLQNDTESLPCDVAVIVIKMKWEWRSNPTDHPRVTVGHAAELLKLYQICQNKLQTAKICSNDSCVICKSSYESSHIRFVPSICFSNFVLALIADFWVPSEYLSLSGVVRFVCVANRVREQFTNPILKRL